MTEAIKIVVPTDFSEQSRAVFDWVRKLADRGHAEVHCVNVVQQPVVYMPMVTGTATASMPDVTDLERISEESLKIFVRENLTDLDMPVIPKVLVGRPAEEITDYAKEIDAQMIVLATRGQSGIAHMMLGSVAEGVVRQAHCAVLTVRG